MKPRPFQEEDVRRIVSEFRGRALVASQMGTGKTATALWALAQLDRWPAVVVCPASVKWVWERESLRAIGVRAAVLEGTRPPDVGAVLRRHDLLILNYDILRHWTGWLLREIRPRVVIPDEIHYAANPGAKRSKALRALCEQADCVIGLSGTPLTSRPSELWHPLHLIRPDLYPRFGSYAHRYCDPRRRPWGWEFKGATRMDELHGNLSRQLMIRRRKEDVLLDLPPKTRTVVPLEIRRPEEYRRARDHFLEWLAEQGEGGRLSAAKRAERLVQLGELKRLAARLKLRAAVEWIRLWFEDSEGGKLVVFASHRKMIEALARRIEQPHVLVDGSVTGRKRKLAVEKFQRDRRTRLFLGNIRAAGQGLTLTAASDVVFSELDWVPAMHTQAEDRVHRITQERPSRAWYLLARGTIEEDLAKIIQRKQRVLSRALDGGPRAEDLDVFDLLEARIRERAR